MFDFSSFTPAAWAVLVAAAFVQGMSKGGFPGISIIAIPWVASVIDGKQATGFILPMLIAGDLFALLYFRRAVSVRDVLRALPWAVVGVVVGWRILHLIPNGSSKVMNYTVAGIVLFILAFQVVKKLMPTAPADDESAKRFSPIKHAFAVFMGFLGGVTTMLANAAGPVMSAYFLAIKLSKATFLGTCAWFFFVVNWMKFPLMLHEGMITAQSLKTNLVLLPAILLGAVTGILVVKRINQKIFEWIIIVLAAAGCVKLII
ncbi:MAG: sulfite exporter TauE/SafE family protein [Kiritimatiellaeota bacterium]|nr:sulfite exporter TauE/SafE family protein [Kiritimatiellota bacterium]